jgi:hypothetical protein
MAGIPPIEPYPLPSADDLPGNTARWSADPDRAVLLVQGSALVEPTRGRSDVPDTLSGGGVGVLGEVPGSPAQRPLDAVTERGEAA